MGISIAISNLNLGCGIADLTSYEKHNIRL